MSDTDNNWDQLFENLPLDVTPSEEHHAELKARSLAEFDHGVTPQVAQPGLMQAKRFLMKYKLPYWTVAALVAGVCISMLSSAPPAVANVVKHIIDARTARWDTIVKSEGSPDQKIKFQFIPGHSRQEFESTGMVMVIDWTRKEAMGLFPGEKRAMLMNASGFDRDVEKYNHFERMRNELRDAMQDPQQNVEELGERRIGEKSLIGFRFSRESIEITIWADPDSGFPVRIETEVDETTQVVMTNYECNFEAEPALFSLEVPDGYRLVDTRDGNSPISMGDEKDLVVSLRLWAEAADGIFPERLDSEGGAQASARYLSMVNKRDLAAGVQPTPEANLELLKRASTGLTFVLELSRKEDWDAHYAGTNVKIDTPNRPIFWYKRGNSDEYRVIYADLSIRDAVEAPNSSMFEVQPMKLAAPADSGN